MSVNYPGEGGIHPEAYIRIHVFFYKHIDFGGEGQIFLAIFQKVPQNMLSIILKKQ